MTAESISFLCRNEQCQSEETYKQNIIHFESPNDNEIECEWCKARYIQSGNSILRKASDEDEGESVILIDSIESYLAFETKYTNVNLYIPKLIIRGIHDTDFNERILSFSKCKIDELIIEDIEITAAFYPLSFSECIIENVQINNGKISRAKLKDFYSSWSFFGLNFYKTNISQSFSIEDFDARILTLDCIISCPIDIKDKSKIEIALLHNTNDPEIKADKSSNYKPIFEVSGKGTESVKKITTTAKALKGISIDELIIDPDINKKISVENCSIKKIIFPEDGNILAELNFTNCFIESVQNEPHCFEKDVVFLGCSFKKDLSLLRASYNQSLVLEACTFQGKLVLNDLVIAKDLHLSFSNFGKDLLISLIECGGFLTSHFSLSDAGIQLDNMRIGRDVNFRNVEANNNLIIKNSDVHGNMFFKRIKIGGKLEFKWLKTNELSLDDMVISQSTSIESSHLDGDFRMAAVHAKDTVNFSFFKMDGSLFITNSIFDSGFEMVYCDTMLSYFSNNTHSGEYNLNSVGISNQSHMISCLYWNDISLSSMHTDDVNFNYNYVLGSFDADATQGANLSFTDNLFLNSLELNNSKANNLKLKNNRVDKKFEIFNSELHDIELTENFIYQSLDISYTKGNDISLNNNHLHHSVIIKNLQSNNLNINDNQIKESLDKEEEKQQEENAENEAKTEEGFIIKQIKTNDLNLNDNNVFISFIISNAEINDFKLFDNTVYKGLEINSTEADNLIFTRNATTKLSMSNGKYTEISVRECTDIGELVFNNVATDKDISLSENIFWFGTKILYCKIENDLDFLQNICKQEFEMHHCRIGNSANFKSNAYNSSFNFHDNFIHGSVALDDRRVNREFTLLKNLVNGNISIQDTIFFSSFLAEENTIAQQFYISGIELFSCAPVRIPEEMIQPAENEFYIPAYQLIPSEAPTIIKNKFNFVKFDSFILQHALYFDQNVVQGNLNWGARESNRGFAGIVFEHPVSISENRMRTVTLNNLLFKSAVCQRNNHIEAGYTLFNTDYNEVMDFSGSFVGGTFSFEKVNPRDDGDLILDNTFIDKRIRFIQTSPSSFSFINATFNGFEIPGNWKLRNNKLINTDKEKDERYLLKETTLSKESPTEAILPYSFIKSYFDTVGIFQQIPSNWTYLQWNVFPKKPGIELLENQIAGGKQLLNYRPLIDSCIQRNFIPVFFNFLKQEQIEELKNLASHFAFYDHKGESQEAIDLYATLKDFFYSFYYALKFFSERKIHWEHKGDKMFKDDYHHCLNDSLMEQYKVLREIYGSNGELENEDRAYYWWKHYLNISEKYHASWSRKLRNNLKYVLYELVFGWGVNLPRIVVSTLIMVCVFAGIYSIMFAVTPGLYVSWDNNLIPGTDIHPLRSLVFALQTTFSAVLGDWAPIGAGVIKIPMTINAILGVLFVTFMIGAYGRKMLR